MLASPTDFPHAGSRGFLAGTADPVTIIRRNADGTSLVRIDGTPLRPGSRDASGNKTVGGDELFGTEREAFEAALPKKAKRKGRK